MNAERESLGLILSLGLNFCLLGSFQKTIAQPVFLLRALLYFNASRLRSKGALKQTIEAPATKASQNSPFTNSVRDWIRISLGQPSSTSARLPRTKSRITRTED